MSITFGLAELLIKLEEVKKATSRRERKELNPTGSVVVDYEPDNVFLDLPLPTVNPPAEFPLFNLDKTPSLNHDHSVSSNVSLTDTVNNIIDFVHDANISINPPPPSNSYIPTPWMESVNKEKGEVLERLQRLEKSNVDRDKSLDLIRIDIDEISEKVNLVMSNTLNNNDKIEDLKSDIDKIDKGVKRYIDNRLANIRTQIEETRIINDKGEITIPILQNIKDALNKEPPFESLKEIRSEIESLKVRNKCEEITISNIRDLAVEVKNKLEQSGLENLSLPGAISNTSSSNISAIMHPSLHISSNRAIERDLVRNTIDNSAKLIHQIIKVKVSETSELSLIRKCNVDIKKITTYSKSCHELLMKYISYEGMDSEYYNTIKALLETSNDWVLEVEQIYSKSEAHTVGTLRGDLSGVGIFSDNADKTVFEFFEELEMGFTGWGTGRQRATLLYSKHLSDEIRSKTLDISDNYHKLKSWLFKEYGSADSIITDIAAGLAAKRKPRNDNRKEKYSFYADITRGLARLEKLFRVPDIDIDDIETNLYSKNTLRTLFLSIPDDDLDQFQRNMALRRIDWRNPKGIRAFVGFKELCETERNIHEPFRGSDLLKSKAKTVFAVDQDHEINSDDEKGIHNSHTTTPPSKWYPSGLTFPCPLKSHNHQMTDCQEFFSLKPKERWDGTGKRKICFTCLRPRDICKEGKCMFSSTIPEELICQGCKPRAKEKGWSTLNILYCRNNNHASTRAPVTEIKKQLEKYIGKLSSSINERNLKNSVNFMHQVYSVTPCPEKPSVLDKNTPVIHSRTGTKITLNHHNILPESCEHSSYLMQTLKIGSSDVLVFFDTGANTNLISGEVAVKESLQQITSKPTKLTVVGGGTIKTEYGSYRFALGPTSAGDYHEITCQGMEQVTSEFKRHDLTEIVTEYRGSVDENMKYLPLPPYVAGSHVHLLLGIKNTYLNPTLIAILPSGVGVYRSPFTDIFGSNIIFAGPHPSFTSHNGEGREDISHAIFHMKESVISRSWEEREIPYSIPVDKNYRFQFHPSPITEGDILDVGGIILDNTEQRVDQICKQSLHHFCSVHKAAVPIAKMRELMNLDNPDDIVSYRCKDCSQCITCKRSPRLTAISIQEALEQSYIESSVKIDFKDMKVVVKLPFMKDPIDFLSKKHNGKSNYRQAKKIYISQCRKSTTEKTGMIKAHQELVERNFMRRLQDCSPEIQDTIRNAPFNHYYPWFIVQKGDSISTPIRLVVDPTLSGMNLILPKGENRMGQILDIIIRNRTRRYIWTSDVSKLYNQLHLDPASHPYSLFLYHDTLDPDTDPHVYVMLRAWYGVISTGGQAGFALDRLAELGKDDFPNAKACLDRDRYVDDIMSGCNSIEDREQQIIEVKNLLAKAGFSLKYVVKSGEAPDSKASNDGETLKLLGYKWNPVSGTMSPGLGELNLNKKSRGFRKENISPVITISDAEKILKPVGLTRRIVISKIAEMFDPLGLWEPIKVQLKLHATSVNSVPWDCKLSEDLQVRWKDILSRFVNIPNLESRRYPFPDECLHDDGIRLICFSDAGKDAGGAAIYAGKKMPDKSWSSALLCARSKMLKGTIPRNELSAILLMAELAYVAKKSLGEQVTEVIYLTDSTIALAWIHNTNIKLRSYIHSRAESSRRLIQMTVNQDEIPLFHIEGVLNLADLLTKPHILETEDVSIGSLWETGHPWMKDHSENFPISKYTDLKVDKSSLQEIQVECFSDPLYPTTLQVHGLIKDHKTTFVTAPGRFKYQIILDPITFGWNRTIRIISAVLAFPQVLIHRKNHKSLMDSECRLCSDLKDPDYRDNIQLAKDVLFRYETNVIKESLAPKQLVKYKETEGILYFTGRLTKDNPFTFVDLDKIPFLDTHEFSGPIPVVLVDSPIVYSLIMQIHNKKLPHAGVEITVKEIFKEILVPGGVRRLIRRIKDDCTTCRILERKTVEIQMSEHPSPRTLIAPPFYATMADVAFGFHGQTYKKSRSVIKLYALVLVCITTGATNILVLEGLETQDICQALERHAARHGIPSDIYIDNGTQLLAMSQVKFSIRDINAQVYDSLGMKVHASTAKSHIERGRVERRIRTVKDLIERMGVQISNPMTAVQWETLFSKVASNLDDLPIARGDSSSVSNLGYDILTPNRLKLGRNNHRSLEGAGFNIEMSRIPSKILERNREVFKTWYQLFIDNIHMLQVRPDKWSVNTRVPVVDDIVLFVLNDSEYTKSGSTWKLGKVLSCEKRKVTISYVSKVTKTGQTTMSNLSRGIRDVSIIFSIDELFINTTDHYESLFFSLFEE